MRLRGLALASAFVAASLTLVACQDLAQLPTDASVPHATIAGSHTETADGRVDTFRITTVGSHPVNDLGADPEGHMGVDATNMIAAGRNVQIEFEGLARYRSSFKNLFWSNMRVEAKVDFVPAPGASYIVFGSLDPAGSSVWIENAATHQVVDHKFVGKPSLPASGAEVKFQDKQGA